MSSVSKKRKPKKQKQPAKRQAPPGAVVGAPTRHRTGAFALFNPTPFHEPWFDDESSAVVASAEQEWESWYDQDLPGLEDRASRAVGAVLSRRSESDFSTGNTFNPWLGQLAKSAANRAVAQIRAGDDTWRGPACLLLGLAAIRPSGLKAQIDTVVAKIRKALDGHGLPEARRTQRRGREPKPATSGRDLWFLMYLNDPGDITYDLNMGPVFLEYFRAQRRLEDLVTNFRGRDLEISVPVSLFKQDVEPDFEPFMAWLAERGWDEDAIGDRVFTLVNEWYDGTAPRSGRPGRGHEARQELRTTRGRPRTKLTFPVVSTLEPGQPCVNQDGMSGMAEVRRLEWECGRIRAPARMSRTTIL